MVTKHNKKNYLIPYESIMQKSYLINQSIQPGQDQRSWSKGFPGVEMIDSAVPRGLE
jgi:hypothetical protein